MADKLLIPCLYLQSGKAVTGFGQRNLFGEGNIEDLVRFYRDNGADELLVFDFSSGDKEHDQAIANRFVRLLKFLLWQLEISIAWKMSKSFFMPDVPKLF